MTAATRRLWLQGLLLFLPALCVGGLAIGLLAREQGRLDERESAAREARRAALEARARLIAENIELLLGDVQTALMATLQEAPADEPRAFLTEWKTTNPLVRDVFRATAAGGVVWGGEEPSLTRLDDPAALRAWLGEAAPWKSTSVSTNADGFAAASAVPEKSASFATPAQAMAEAENVVVGSAYNDDVERRQRTNVELKRLSAEAARGDVSWNVGQYQQARKEIQEVARLRNASDVAASQNGYVIGMPSVAVAAAPAPASVAPPAMAKASAMPADATAGKNEAVAAGVPVDAQAFEGKAVAPAEIGDFDAQLSAATLPKGKNVYVRAENESAGAAAAPKPDVWGNPPGVWSNQFADTPITRSGWTPWRDRRGELHLFAWRELPDRTVVGCELAMEAVTSRIAELFPTISGTGPWEIYSLADETTPLRKSIVDGARMISVATTSWLSVEVPLSPAMLPSWWVRGSLSGVGAEPVSAGVFGPGAAIIALLMLSILAAGALLVRRVRASEEEAAQKTSFVANVSHELKTPLTTIRLYAELLEQGRVRDETKRSDYLATIGRETQRLGRLVANVLDFSRLEQGKKKFDLAMLDLAAELRRLAATHGPRLEEAGLAPMLEAPETLSVVTDRDAVEQIVLNLLDNAVKYAAEGGEVSLALAAREGRAELRVADRGPGVPAEQRERIFEKFHRVDERLVAEKGGAGLGLSIARQLARGLGGELRCEARAGGGAEFVLTLPLPTSHP